MSDTVSDLLVVAALVINTPGSSVSLKRLAKRAPASWGPERLEAAVKELEAKGCLQAFGGTGGHYWFEPERVQAVVSESGMTTTEILMSTVEVAPAGADDTDDDAQAECAEQAEQPVAADKPAAEAEPRKRLSRLESILNRINSMPAEKVYEGDERTAAINQAFEQAMKTTEAVNEGIAALALRSSVVNAKMLISLRRIIPEGDGTGGVVMTYSPYKGKVITLFRRGWAERLTDSWLKKFSRDCERAAVGLLEGLANKAMRACGSHSARSGQAKA